MNPLPEGEMPLKEIRLDQLLVGVQAQLPRYVMETARVESVWAHELDALIVSLRAYVLADHLASRAFPVDITCDIAVDQWASWWQHTKAVHFPTLSRWLRRPPRQVQETRTVTGQKWVDVQSYAAFPDAAIYPPDLGPVHVLQRTEVVR